ncbi:unnamed protein product [Chondrus crispus]|uniref:Uncharacterized protein n=1 Tax=Chondrus crispus TaxID=2769 RepID=R7QUG0_CHOCR|nr:unnamed protein product [Chondrus crispus]CDF41116.1 unnamed protein product [Chondrus crispus]|eukprot:XP_005711410.1 unnamed protein product [Chondrus crispus]
MHIGLSHLYQSPLVLSLFLSNTSLDYRHHALLLRLPLTVQSPIR